MELIKVDTYEQLSEKACDMVKEQMTAKENSVLGLATGSTPIGLYENLIKLHDQGVISFSKMTTFNLDEYVGLAPSHSQSYYYFMQEKLFKHVDMKKENIHIPSGVAEDLEAECERFEEKLKTLGPTDLQILGLGVNGHIGFNEPGTSFNSRTQIVELDSSTREANARFFETIEEVPTHAITMGIESIMESKKIVLLAFGENKKEALERLFSGEVTEDFPASILNNHPNVTVIYG
ncbi:glucosamine-6-phosphate deaminase [Bacillaceae bacterium W0354]